jgi:uncharacterized protein (TIGR03067 family)
MEDLMRSLFQRLKLVALVLLMTATACDRTYQGPVETLRENNVVSGEPAAAAPNEDEATKEELEKLQGTWRVVTVESNGEVSGGDDDKGATITIEKNIISEWDGAGTWKLIAKETFKFDLSKLPKAMDQTCVFNGFLPENKGKTTYCIYELDNDTLKLASPFAGYKQRPMGFTTKQGSKFSVYTFKRVKSKKKE